MPNYNNGKFIRSAIESVLKQTFNNTELLIVDDGSEDDSIGIIQHYLEAGEGIRLLRTEGKRGSAAARNIGISNARGELIAFIDSDDMWVSTKLERQIEAYSSNEPSIIYHDWLRIDEFGNVLPPGRLKRPRKSGYVFEDFLSLAFGACSMFLVPRKFLDSGHLFDESLPWAEDLDFSLKLAKDFTFCYLDEKLYCYRIHKQSKTWTMPRIERITWESRVIEKHFESNKKLMSEETKIKATKLLASYYRKTHQYYKLMKLKLGIRIIG